MKSKAFWTGISFQAIQFFALIIFLMGSFDWSFVTVKFLAIGFWILMNLLSLFLILYGAIGKEDSEY